MTVFTRLERAKYYGPKKCALILFDLVLREIDRKLNRSRLLFNPTSIQIEPTTKCNFKCKFCESSSWNRRGMDMSFSDFKKIIDQFPFLGEILLQGIGEPLLNKDFFKMVDYCKSNKLFVGTTTNASLIDKQMIKNIIDSGLDWISISIVGAKKQTFEENRVGANFEQILDNVRDLVNVRGDKKTPVIIFRFTAAKENLNELPQVIKMAKEIGIDRIEAQASQFWGKEEYVHKFINDSIRSDIDGAKKILTDCIMKSKELGIPFSWDGGLDYLFDSDNTYPHPKHESCRQVFEFGFITVDGYVTPCAGIPDPNVLNFGNVFKNDFKTIWNSPQYVNIRKMRIKGDVLDICKTCM